MERKSILFLDFDGVLNNETLLRWQRNHSPDHYIFDHKWV